MRDQELRSFQRLVDRIPVAEGRAQLRKLAEGGGVADGLLWDLYFFAVSKEYARLAASLAEDVDRCVLAPADTTGTAQFSGAETEKSLLRLAKVLVEGNTAALDWKAGWKARCGCQGQGRKRKHDSATPVACFNPYHYSQAAAEGEGGDAAGDPAALAAANSNDKASAAEAGGDAAPMSVEADGEPQKEPAPGTRTAAAAPAPTPGPAPAPQSKKSSKSSTGSSRRRGDKSSGSGHNPLNVLVEAASRQAVLPPGASVSPDDAGTAASAGGAAGAGDGAAGFQLVVSATVQLRKGASADGAGAHLDVHPTVAAPRLEDGMPPYRIGFQVMVGICVFDLDGLVGYKLLYPLGHQIDAELSGPGAHSPPSITIVVEGKPEKSVQLERCFADATLRIRERKGPPPPGKQYHMSLQKNPGPWRTVTLFLRETRGVVTMDPRIRPSIPSFQFLLRASHPGQASPGGDLFILPTIGGKGPPVWPLETTPYPPMHPPRLSSADRAAQQAQQPDLALQQMPAPPPEPATAAATAAAAVAAAAAAAVDAVAAPDADMAAAAAAAAAASAAMSGVTQIPSTIPIPTLSTPASQPQTPHALRPRPARPPSRGTPSPPSTTDGVLITNVADARVKRRPTPAEMTPFSSSAAAAASEPLQRGPATASPPPLAHAPLTAAPDDQPAIITASD